MTTARLCKKKGYESSLALIGWRDFRSFFDSFIVVHHSGTFLPSTLFETIKKRSVDLLERPGQWTSSKSGLWTWKQAVSGPRILLPAGTLRIIFWFSAYLFISLDFLSPFSLFLSSTVQKWIGHFQGHQHNYNVRQRRTELLVFILNRTYVRQKPPNWWWVSMLMTLK